MKTIRALLVDDEFDALVVLKLLLQKHEHIDVVDTAQSVDEAREIIFRAKPDLVFLDIEMPQKSGFELLNAFPKPDFKVIFVTAYDQYAIKAFKYSALDYILKPVQATELEAAINKVIEQRNLEDLRLEQLHQLVEKEASFDRIIITSKKGFIVLQLDQIVRIESMPGNYAFFFLEDGRQFLCTKPLNHYEDILPEQSFFRIHRSFMVNLRHVVAFDNEGAEVTLIDQKKLPVAVRRRTDFRKLVRAHFGMYPGV